MDNKEHKRLVLEASKIILKEYEAREHSGMSWDCELCKNFRSDDNGITYCTECPMKLFEVKTKALLGCQGRKCSLVYQLKSSLFNPSKPNDTDRVIDFYKEFIKLVEKSQHCRLTTKSGAKSLFAKRLKALDERVFKKYENL